MSASECVWLVDALPSIAACNPDTVEIACVPVWFARWMAYACTAASAEACAVDTGLLASAVLSTLPSPTSAFASEIAPWRPATLCTGAAAAARALARGLVVWLSPPGRGRILTHGLLPEEKLEKVRAKLGVAGQSFAAGATEPLPATADRFGDDQDDDEDTDAGAVTVPRPAAHAAALANAQPSAPAIALVSLVEKIAALEGEVAALRARLDALESALGN